MNQSSLVRDDFFSLRGEYYGPTKKDEIYIKYSNNLQSCG